MSNEYAIKQEELNGKSTLRTYVKGEFICNQGDPSSQIYILKKGSVQIVINNMVVSTISEPYTPMGELSFLLNSPRSASMVAVEESEIYLFDNQEAEKLLQRTPALYRKILINLTKGFLEKEQRYLGILDDLEKRVEQRTEKLNQANKELTELNDFKNEMIGMAAHDLRNPLGAVQGYLDVILNFHGDQVSEKVGERLKRMSTILTEVNEMLTNLLDVSMIESGKLVLNQSRVNLHEIVMNAIHHLQFLADQKAIVIHPPEVFTPYYSEVDSKRFLQVIENLIGNAIKYSPYQSNIYLSLTQTQTHNNVVIKDEGPGIPKEEQEKIFTRFYRLKNRSKELQGSVGLGLAIVKKIMDMHEGLIHLESSPGDGATFVVSFLRSD